MNAVLQTNPLLPGEMTTPAGKSTPSHVLCLRFRRRIVRPLLSVQKEFNLTSGIRRGYSDYAGRLMMDHILHPSGQPLFGPDMRLSTISVWEHQLRIASRGDLETKRILAIVGNGNLTQNPGFISWHAPGGEFIRVASEPVNDRSYDCIVVDREGNCSVQQLRFEPSDSVNDLAGWRPFVMKSGVDLAASVAFAFSGQRLVVDSLPTSRDRFDNQVLGGSFYDLRHVFRFAAVKVGKYWKDVGLERFYSQGSINTATVDNALRGMPITTRWRDLTDDAELIRKGFAEKGYTEVGTEPAIPGEYRFDNSYLQIIYLNGIYCHNVLGIDSDGDLVCMQVTGRSNNVGATLGALSELAARVFQDAILVDNGGDVFCLLNRDPGRSLIGLEGAPANPDSALVKSCENRYFIRSVILLTAPSSLKNTEEAITSINLPAIEPMNDVR